MPCGALMASNNSEGGIKGDQDKGKITRLTRCVAHYDTAGGEGGAVGGGGPRWLQLTCIPKCMGPVVRFPSNCLPWVTRHCLLGPPGPHHACLCGALSVLVALSRPAASSCQAAS